MGDTYLGRLFQLPVRQILVVLDQPVLGELGAILLLVFEGCRQQVLEGGVRGDREELVHLLRRGGVRERVEGRDEDPVAEFHSCWEW